MIAPTEYTFDLPSSVFLVLSTPAIPTIPLIECTGSKDEILPFRSVAPNVLAFPDANGRNCPLKNEITCSLVSERMYVQLNICPFLFWSQHAWRCDLSE